MSHGKYVWWSVPNHLKTKAKAGSTVSEHISRRRWQNVVLTIPFLLKEVKRTGGSKRKKFLWVQETDNSLLEWELQRSTHSTVCAFRLHYVCGKLRYKHCIREVQDKAFLLFSNMILGQNHKKNMETIKDDCLDAVSGNMQEWNSLWL